MADCHSPHRVCQIHHEQKALTPAGCFRCRSCRRDENRRYDALRQKLGLIALRTPKGRARRLTAQAVDAGRLVKPANCERCAQPFASPRLQAHHHDYSKPYDVQWVCQQCHTLIHLKAKGLATWEDLTLGSIWRNRRKKMSQTFRVVKAPDSAADTVAVIRIPGAKTLYRLAARFANLHTLQGTP